MSKKSAKPVTDIVKSEDAVPVKEATIDTIYQNILDKAVLTYQRVQASSLEWAWDLGSFYAEFEAKVAGKEGRTMAVFIRDLNERSFMDAGESTLYFSKRMFDKYKREALPEMAKSGFGTHKVKAKFALENDPELLQSVMSAAILPDGKFVSDAEFDRIIKDKRQAKVTSANSSAAETTVMPSQAKPRQGGVVEDKTPEVSEEPANDGLKSPEAPPKAEAKKDDGKTGSRGMTAEKEYSASPQKALKATDNACTKLLSSLADTIIAATEITKIGFNHAPTKEAVRVLLASAKGGVSELLKALPDIEKRLQEALYDVSG